jgi:hypothetical protein
MGTKKVFRLIAVGTILAYVCIFLSYNLIFPQLLINGFSGNVFLGLVISWIPVFVFIGIGVVYLLAFTSNKYVDVLPLIYGYGFTFLTALASIFLLKLIIGNINILIINIFLSGLFMANMALQLIISNKLTKLFFDVSYEMEMVKKLMNILDRDEELKALHQFQKRINRIHYGFFILCVVNASFYIFLAVMAVTVLITFKPLLQLKREYLHVGYVSEKQTIWILINYYICMTLSVPAYLCSPMLAWVTTYLKNIAQAIFDNRFTRKKYADLELLQNNHNSTGG